MNRANPILRTAVILTAIVCALAVFDQFLARTEKQEVQREARDNFLTGSALLRAGKAGAAVEALRTAHVLARQNPEYQRELAAALLAAGKISEAKQAIDETLQREPNDGQANLIAARLMAAQDLPREARAYYHRAIYGNWGRDQVAKAAAARMELVEMLMREGNRAEAIPELISLSEESMDASTRRKLANHFRLAGAPNRAANIYRDLIARDPEDVEAYQELGEAELEQGDYRAARNAFVKAFSRGRHARMLPRLGLVNTVVSLDPTPRQLTSLEKYQRSIRILRMVRDEVARQPLPSDQAVALLKEADAALSRKVPAHASNEMAEQVLDVAQKLWEARKPSPEEPVSGEREALALIMKKLGA